MAWSARSPRFFIVRSTTNRTEPAAPSYSLRSTFLQLNVDATG